jgi:hypothetical protein
MKKLFLFLLVVLFAGVAHATTYYLRADGTSADTDCSESSPCCAGAGDVSVFNSATFLNGDIIYMCDDGGDFAGTTSLLINDAGITLQGHSSGRPAMTGSKVVTGWSLSSDCDGGCSNTYEATEDNAGYDSCVSGNRFTVFEDYRFLIWRESVALVESNAGSVFYDTTTNKIYIHPIDSDNPTSNGYTYRATQLLHSIVIDGAIDDVTIKDIDFHHSVEYSIKPYKFDGGVVYTPANLTYDNLTMSGFRHDGFGIMGVNNTLKNCTVSYAYNHAAFLMDDNGTDQDVRSTNMLFENNTVGPCPDHDVMVGLGKICSGLSIEGPLENSTLDGLNIEGEVSVGVLFENHGYATDVENLKLKNIEVNDCFTALDFGDEEPDATVVEGFTMNEICSSTASVRLGSSTNTAIQGSILQGATGENSKAINLESSDGTIIKFNVIKNYETDKFGISIESTADNINISNNVFYNGSYGVYSNTNGNTVNLFNNIFHTLTMPIAMTTLDDITSSNYNLFYNYTSLAGVNYATWQSWGFDANSVEGSDPLLNADYSLLFGSPAINAGVDPFSDGDGDQYDYAGQFVWDDSTDSAVGPWADGVEIGAYGFDDGAAALLIGF